MKPRASSENPKFMNICPYCGGKIPDKKTSCPHCGKEYWLPGEEKRIDREDIIEEAERPGCLQIMFMPLAIALASACLLVLVGFLLNLFIHFESNQMKIAWVGASCALGLAVYHFLSRKRKPKEERDRKI